MKATFQACIWIAFGCFRLKLSAKQNFLGGFVPCPQWGHSEHVFIFPSSFLITSLPYNLELCHATSRKTASPKKTSPNLVRALVLFLLLKLPARKMEFCFILCSFFLLSLVIISINLPYGLARNTAVMSRMDLIVATWICWINYRKKVCGTVGPSLDCWTFGSPSKFTQLKSL